MAVHREWKTEWQLNLKFPHFCELKTDLYQSANLFLSTVFALSCSLCVWASCRDAMWKGLLSVSAPVLQYSCPSHPTYYSCTWLSRGLQFLAWENKPTNPVKNSPLPLNAMHATASTVTLYWRGFSRIPEESLYQTGMIRQRQRCLESQKPEGQDFPALSLNPCITSKGGAAVAQVSVLGDPDGPCHTGGKEGRGAPKYSLGILMLHSGCDRLREVGVQLYL